MNKALLILLVLLSNSFLVEASTITCGNNQIENCKECGKDDKSNSCGTCEAGYFPLLNNLFCIECNDPVNGQIGCKGDCINNNSSSSVLALCQDCEEGYYNIDGLCLKCENKNPGCSSCTYEKNETTGWNKFKCLKCLNEEVYRINENSRCVQCNETISNCKKCHFKGNQGIEAQCDECEKDFSLNSEGECISSISSISSCFDPIIQVKTGGKCYEYSQECGKPNYCECNSGYTLFNQRCEKCGSGCEKCEYNEDTKSTKCLKCSQKYALNSQNECISCGRGCLYCEIDANNKPKCLACSSNYYLIDDNQCLSSPSFCNDYEYDSTKNKMICYRCYFNNYALDQESGGCKSCSDIEELGNGCSSCLYDYSNKKYQCTACNTYYYPSYSFVNNTFQCLSNMNSEQIGLYGCEKSKYIESTKTYECLDCSSGYIKIINDKSCISPSKSGLSSYCLEAEKKGEIYNCLQCGSNYALIENMSTNTKNCYIRQDELSYCLEGKIENGEKKMHKMC